MKDNENILLVGSPSSCRDLAYISGFRAPDPFVFLLKKRKKRTEKFMVVSQLEYGRAVRQCIGTQVFTPDRLMGRPRKRQKRGQGEWIARLLKRENVRTVTVPAAFPLYMARLLEEKGIRVRLSPQALFPEREIKRRDEIGRIQSAQQAAVLAMNGAVSMVAGSEIGRDGYLKYKGKHLASEDLHKTISRIALEHDCLCKDTIAAGGNQAIDCHEMGHGPLKAHEAIVIDIFPQHLIHGYWGDLTRTVVKGAPSQNLKKLYLAVKAAQSAALSRVKPGVKCETVHQAVLDEFKRRGYGTEVVNGVKVGFTHSTGHGVGLDIHEAPGVAPGSKTRLKAGHVITVEPGLYYPDIGGVRIEDTVVVTARGWRYLAPCEKKFEF